MNPLMILNQLDKTENQWIIASALFQVLFIRFYLMNAV